jgi:hypothetical protein
MRMRAIFTCLAVVAGCSSETVGSGSSSGGSACPDISGNYSVQVERVSGSCDVSIDRPTSTLGVTKNADGTFTLIFPGLEGGCPATLDAASCRITVACAARGADGSTIATSNLDYVFSSKGYTGSSATGILPPAVPSGCDVTYRETGTKL